jgi:hypothetical protein
MDIKPVMNFIESRISVIESFPDFESSSIYNKSESIKVYEKTNIINKGPLNLNTVKCTAFEIGVFRDEGNTVAQKIYIRIKTELEECEEIYEVKRNFEEF